MKKSSKKTKSQFVPEVWLHGEAMISSLEELPRELEKIERNDYLIIAPSETTGNHHVVDATKGVEFFQDSNGKMFMRVSDEGKANVRCILPDRHSTVELPPGNYEFGTQQQYDHLEQHMRAVRD